MIVTTTPSIEGQKITQYHGIVVGEAILGANIFRDLFAQVRDIVGGRSAAYEEELGKARTVALEEMQERAPCPVAQCVARQPYSDPIHQRIDRDAKPRPQRQKHRRNADA